MNKSGWIFLAAIVVLLAAAAGYFAGHRGGAMGTADQASTAGASDAQRKVLYWKAPMDTNFRSDKPGKSPMGMELVPVYANDSGGGESSDVKISPAVVNNLGVRTALVERGPLSRSLQAVGYVAWDEDTIASINTRADGWIEKLAVKSVGDPVRRGQLLYELFSPKLATAQREYLIALTSGSDSLIAASRERMRALGFSAGQIAQLTRDRKVSDRVARYADTAGVLVSLGVSEGAYVMPATQVMKLAALDPVWVQAEVDQAAAAQLAKGQPAVAEFDAFPGQRWQGMVDYVYPDINPMTRTLKVRMRFANPQGRLQPNMYAHVTLQTAPRADVLYIPSQALIQTGQSQRVALALGDGRFDICPVQAGFSNGDRVAILKGLRVGQRVVVSAQFLIDSEANVDAAALRLGSGQSACSGAPTMSGNDGMSGMTMPGQSMSAMPMPGMSEKMSTQQPSMQKNADTNEGQHR